MTEEAPRLLKSWCPVCGSPLHGFRYSGYRSMWSWCYFKEYRQVRDVCLPSWPPGHAKMVPPGGWRVGDR